MKCHYYLFTFLLLIFINESYAQSTELKISGNIKDTINQSIVETATVVLHKLSDKRIWEQQSSAKGFSLEALEPGKYLLVTSAKNYYSDSTYIILNKVDMHVTVFLRYKIQELPEVIVKANIPPVVVKGDTIAYNAMAFAVPPRANVEDLLKQLPGILVDKDGNITLNGQKIDKIKIDGKDFFMGDTKTPSQKLPAEIINQIEAYDTHTEKSDWTGIREVTGGKTLNLKLKANRKRGIFGTAKASTTIDGRYDIGLSATTLSPSKMMMGNGSINNISNIGGSGSPSAGIQQSKNFGINYRDDWGKKLTATIGGNYAANKSSMGTVSEKSSFLTDSTIIENRVSNTNSKNNGFNISPRLEFKVDSMHELSFNANVSIGKVENENLDTVAMHIQNATNYYLSSQGKTLNESRSKSLGLQNSINYKQRFKKRGRTIFATISQSLQDQKQPNTIFSSLILLDNSGIVKNTSIQRRQFAQVTKTNNYNGSIMYTQPIVANQVLAINYSFGLNNNLNDRLGFLYDSSKRDYTIPDSVNTNRFENKNNSQNISVSYNIERNKWRSQFGLALNAANQQSLNKTNGISLKQNFLNWIPTANINYKLGQSKSLGINYSGSTIAPSTEQLRPVPDLSNPYLTKMGNPDLKQSIQQNLGFNFNSNNMKNFSSFMAGLMGSYDLNKITMATTTLPGGIQQQQFVNVNGVFNLSGNINYGFPSLRKAKDTTQTDDAGLTSPRGGAWGEMSKLRANIGCNLGYNQDMVPINGVNGITRNVNANINLNINYTASEKFNLSLISMLNYAKSSGQNNTSPGRASIMQTHLVNIRYELPLGVRFTSNFNLQLTAAQAQIPANNLGIWNASIAKSVLGRHAGLIQLSAYDLLNSSNQYNQTLTSNTLETKRTNTLGKLIVLSFLYDFRKFPKGKPVKQDAFGTGFGNN